MVSLKLTWYEKVIAAQSTDNRCCHKLVVCKFLRVKNGRKGIYDVLRRSV